MKVVFILIIILIKVNIILSQNETDIYSQVFDNFILKSHPTNNNESVNTILIVKKPIFMSILNKKDFNKFKAKFNLLEESTFVNFLVGQNEKLLETLKVIKNEIVFLDSILVKDSLALKYPNWNHYLYEFSNIGFNQSKTQAILYYGFSGLGIGGGIYLIFKKKWKEVKTYQLGLHKKQLTITCNIAKKCFSGMQNRPRINFLIVDMDAAHNPFQAMLRAINVNVEMLFLTSFI